MSVNLFNAKTYASLYPDLGAAGLTTPQQLEAHYRNIGITEGRITSEFVNLRYYGRSYPDLGRAGLTTNTQLLSHLENLGANEGRRSSVGFNPSFYRAVHTDLTNARLTNEQLYQHFNVIGLSEGRASSEFFNAPYYLATNSDLAAAFGNNNYQAAFLHFVNNGFREGRVGSPPVSPSTDPSNVSSSAYDLGTLLAKGTFVDFVGTSDRDDYYGFRVDKPINLNLNLSGLSDTVTLKLFADTNDNGRVDPEEEIASVNGNASTPAVINKTLGAGYYHIDVLTQSPATNTFYSLAMSPTEIPSLTTDPGDNQPTAFSLGTLASSRTVSDFVGSTDRIDFYSFVLDGNKTLNLSLNGTTDPAYALLYQDVNQNNFLDSTEVLGIVNSSNNSLGALTQNLGAGTYFVEVFTNTTTANTSYNMTLAV